MNIDGNFKEKLKYNLDNVMEDTKQIVQRTVKKARQGNFSDKFMQLVELKIEQFGLKQNFNKLINQVLNSNSDSKINLEANDLVLTEEFEKQSQGQHKNI